jgi:hypothetical protein
MLGDIVQLADNLWLVVGDMPADIPNSIIYLQNDRLYLMDTGAGPTIRASIMQVLRTVSPVHSFTLLNSHGHTDHIGNNDIIRMVHANNTSHYLSEAGLAMLDPVQYFADQFYKLSDIYDPAIGFQAHRLRWRFLGVLRDILGLFIGERRVLGMIFSVYLRKFQPFRPSLETIQPMNHYQVNLLRFMERLSRAGLWVKMMCGSLKREVIRLTRYCSIFLSIRSSILVI